MRGEGGWVPWTQRRGSKAVSGPCVGLTTAAQVSIVTPIFKVNVTTASSQTFISPTLP